MTGNQAPTIVAAPIRDTGEQPLALGGHGLRTRRRGQGRAAALFLAPWACGLIFITIGPLLASLYLSFTHYNLSSAPQWAGLANYREMFSDPRFFTSLEVTFKYVGISVPLVLAGALALALLLNRGMRGLAIYRTLFYIPTLIGSSVAIAVLWTEAFSVNGAFNHLLSLFHIQGPPWLGDPSTALYTLIVLQVWTFGGIMVIFLAGLRQIPRELYEAATVDGAGMFHRFRRITLPLLSPIVFFNGILALVGAFQTFTPAFIISSGTGGPIDSTLLYSLYLYQQGFVDLQMGYASAMAWFLLLIIAGFTGLAFASSRYWVFYRE